MHNYAQTLTCLHYASLITIHHLGIPFFLVTVLNLWSKGRRFEFRPFHFHVTTWAVHTHVPLSASSIIWYWPKGGDALRVVAIPLTNYCPSVLDTVGWVIWPVKIVPDMTYNVFSGTLNPTLLLYIPLIAWMCDLSMSTYCQAHSHWLYWF